MKVLHSSTPVYRVFGSDDDFFSHAYHRYGRSDLFTTQPSRTILDPQCRYNPHEGPFGNVRIPGAVIKMSGVPLAIARRSVEL